MAPTLRLMLTDYVDPTRWRWALHDNHGRFLADHTVQLDPSSREYRGFVDLSGYLEYHQPIYPPKEQLAKLGAWIGEHVFGGLRTALQRHSALPAVAVHMVVPETAHALLSRPFELASFADSKTFREAGLRFIYQLAGASDPVKPKEPADKSLRILAVFSLPVRSNPLNLRRERYELQRFVRELNQTQGRAVELRVLQYGATRNTLREELEDGEGWDIIHLSGHGERGELLLENERGDSDKINGEDLGALLELARQRLKLLILDACYSGASSHAAARVQVGLDKEPLRQESAENDPKAETTQTTLPSLAQELARRLDCAALAMRYPVGDAFATELMLALYRKLLTKQQPLPAALHLALDDALKTDVPRPPLSPVTPILLGSCAADLKLVPPQRPLDKMALSKVGLGIAFPPEPERFVGRLQPMLRASQALAPQSALRGVLFYGMPGAGKTSCALELAYRHSERRFQGYVWYQAPEVGSDITSALSNVLFEIERQLDEPDLGLTTALDDPKRFRNFTLPRLRGLLQQHSLLLVLDNMESLLTESSGWRDPLWGEFVAALLNHNGPSRVVLTTRRLPIDLERHQRLQVEAIYALSFAESVLLARELPNLKRLFGHEEGRKLLQNTLRLVQGHPKLLELADKLAADCTTLTERLVAISGELTKSDDVLDAFFATGGEREGETRQTDDGFMAALQRWTANVVGDLSGIAHLLFVFLCQLEPSDRKQWAVQTTWKYFLASIEGKIPAAAAALAKQNQGLPAAMASLESTGLVAVERPEFDLAQMARLQKPLTGVAGQEYQTSVFATDAMQALSAHSAYIIHPCVAEATRAAADPVVLAAVDMELGNFYLSTFLHSKERERQGGGRAVVSSARLAIPYLLRQARWEEASTLLEQMLHRDDSPATLDLAMPLLRRIVEATAETASGLSKRGLLARALQQAGRVNEAEQMMRDVIALSTSQGDYRTASSTAGGLLILLRTSGRLAEALAMIDEKVDRNRSAGRELKMSSKGQIRIQSPWERARGGVTLCSL